MGTIIFIIRFAYARVVIVLVFLVQFAIIGSVDIAVRMMENLEAERPHNAPDMHRILVKRGAGWLTVGALFGVSTVLWYHTYNPTRAVEVWQPEAILYIAMRHFCWLILMGGMVFQIHRDSPANIWRLYCLIYGSKLLANIGNCSPYPFLYALGTVFSLLFRTVGVYVAVVHLDQKAEPSAIKNGYVFFFVLLIFPLWGSHVSQF